MTTSQIHKAVDILRAGGLVAFPTETVYGLGADATNEVALKRIFIAKERPLNHPLIVHLANINQLPAWAKDIPESAIKLAEAFWPGPLTLILTKQSHVLDIVTAGQTTIGLRVPKHPIAHALLNAFGGGIAAPSANKFTHVSPTTAQAVCEELGDKVDLVLDGGDCEIGLESTIVDVSRGEPIILRPGMITPEMMSGVLHAPVSFARADATPILAPGMHHLHYAPTTQTLLLSTQDLKSFLLNQTEWPIAILAYSDKPPHFDEELAKKILWKKMPMDAKQYAHDLYQALRMLDKAQVKRIIIEAVPENQEWVAINDRLRKASGTKGTL